MVAGGETFFARMDGSRELEKLFGRMAGGWRETPLILGGGQPGL